jgi:deazaflavin-dependent oxidoreductase (nitroreductase family)
MLYGDAHVEAYRRTDGAEGYEWKDGSHIILLTTIGHRSGEERTVPLIFGKDGDDYLIVASKGGADEPPAWYVNLEANPEVTVQDRADVFKAVARTATPEEQARLWPIVTKEWPPYDEYQSRTTRRIPVVILQRADG